MRTWSQMYFISLVFVIFARKLKDFLRFSFIFEEVHFVIRVGKFLLQCFDCFWFGIHLSPDPFFNNQLRCKTKTKFIHGFLLV